MDENKIKAIDGVLAQIEKQYGKGAIMRLGQKAADEGLEVLPTGCLSLDLAIKPFGTFRGLKRPKRSSRGRNRKEGQNIDQHEQKNP